MEAQNDFLEFREIYNNGEKGMMVELLQAKNVFSRQLPKMPKEYIIRILFDKRHEVLVIKKNCQTIGGVCYGKFPEVGMVEIVFLAILQDHQVRGYGTKLMSTLKNNLKHRGFHFLMTCADNLAIGYFVKQGFSSKITVPPVLYKDYLKSYEGSTLMQTILDERIDYETLSYKLRQ